jgi:hypothetical protein
VPAGAKRKRQYQERQERDRTDKAGQVRRQRDGGGALNAADRMGLDERRSARHDPSKWVRNAVLRDRTAIGDRTTGRNGLMHRDHGDHHG